MASPHWRRLNERANIKRKHHKTGAIFPPDCPQSIYRLDAQLYLDEWQHQRWTFIWFLLKRVLSLSTLKCFRIQRWTFDLLNFSVSHQSAKYLYKSGFQLHSRGKGTIWPLPPNYDTQQLAAKVKEFFRVHKKAWRDPFVSLSGADLLPEMCPTA